MRKTEVGHGKEVGSCSKRWLTETGSICLGVQKLLSWHLSAETFPFLFLIEDSLHVSTLVCVLNSFLQDFNILTLRMLTTSDPLRTKDAAMKSMSLIRPHLVKSSSSLFVNVGRSTTTPGRFTFLRSLHATTPSWQWQWVSTSAWHLVTASACSLRRGSWQWAESSNDIDAHCSTWLTCHVHVSCGFPSMRDHLTWHNIHSKREMDKCTQDNEILWFLDIRTL